MDPSRAILGTYGSVYIDGIWQTNINHLEAKIDVDKRELNLVGYNWKQYKIGAKNGTGTISGYKVSSAMLQRGFSKFEIITKLDDPEAYGFERIRLSRCMPDSLQIANWTAGEEVTEETPFTFEGYELLDPITDPTATPTTPTTP
ncbi:phage tail tube protein [Paenibacillus sp. P32E]|uniref:phage tail tube protein n=1 Tax=Paenibacillus sp. P32E TaxID=1349434 RepID=UPI001C4A3D5B|nr:phage tail tube protein [Paenibacillus sp. P32E]